MGLSRLGPSPEDQLSQNTGQLSVRVAVLPRHARSGFLIKPQSIVLHCLFTFFSTTATYVHMYCCAMMVLGAGEFNLLKKQTNKTMWSQRT